MKNSVLIYLISPPWIDCNRWWRLQIIHFPCIFLSNSRRRYIVLGREIQWILRIIGHDCSCFLFFYFYFKTVFVRIHYKRNPISCRIHRLHLYPGYDTKQSDDEASHLELSGRWSSLSFPLLPCLLPPSVLVPLRVPSMGQIELVSSILHEIIWWWGSSSEALGSVEYSFIAIIPRSIWHGALGNVEYPFIAITPRSIWPGVLSIWSK